MEGSPKKDKYELVENGRRFSEEEEDDDQSERSQGKESFSIERGDTSLPVNNGEGRKVISKGTLKTILKNLVFFGLLVLSNYMYYLSTGTCPNTEAAEEQICVGYIKEYYSYWIIEEVSSALIMLFLVFMVRFRKASKWWLLVIAINLYLMWNYKTGLTIKDHGAINRWGLLVLIGVCLILYGFIYGNIKLYKFSRLLFAATIGTYMSLFLWFYFAKISNSCGDWEMGVGGHSLINSPNNCQIPIPVYCELNTRTGILDFVRFYPTCSNTHTVLSKEEISESIRDKENLSRIGYQRVENVPFSVLTDQFKFRSYVHENMIDMDDPSVSAEVKDNVEFTVDISDPKQHKLEINVTPNVTRAEEQKKLRDEIINGEKLDGTYENRLDKNVILIYIDNLSRSHFLKTLPKTGEWLAQFVDNQDGDYTTYQYFRYHSVFYNTQYSSSALYYGDIEDLDDTSTNVFDSFTKNGYITGFFKDACQTNSVSLADENIRFHRWDHFGGTISCDPNFDNQVSGGLDIFSGKSSSIRHCLYGQDMHNIQMEYIKQFWAAYPDNRKFFRTHFSEAHELFGDLIYYMDEDLRDLLQYFYEMNYLEDTMITIMSDHGAHDLTMRWFFIPDDSRYIENYLPLLFHVTKNDIPKGVAHYLEANEQSFIGSHDIYANLKTIAENKISRSPGAESYAYAFEMPPTNNSYCSNSTVYRDCWCSKDIEFLRKRMDHKGLFYTQL